MMAGTLQELHLSHQQSHQAHHEDHHGSHPCHQTASHPQSEADPCKKVQTNISKIIELHVS
jgi:hypothetical protein